MITDIHFNLNVNNFMSFHAIGVMLMWRGCVHGCLRGCAGWWVSVPTSRYVGSCGCGFVRYVHAHVYSSFSIFLHDRVRMELYVEEEEERNRQKEKVSGLTCLMASYAHHAIKNFSVFLRCPPPNIKLSKVINN